MADYSIQTLTVGPGPNDRSVKTDSGEVLSVPVGWQLLPPGDAGVTRRVKAAGPTWTVKTKVGRRIMSLGVWACAKQIEQATASMESTRATAQHAKQLESSRKRREEKQVAYVEDFFGAVVAFLRFHPRYESIANQFAQAVTQHATPVGSGTVARTERIPIEQRAESAVIAWMRHQTTAYDDMKIARVKGKRREVRRELAEQSRKVLQKYRQGIDAATENCPLARAVV
jgi:hypothetical protein